MKSNTNNKIDRLLKDFNLRHTSARVAILGVLAETHKPQTAEQIASRLSPEGPDKVTIYRTLESFIKAGFVHKAYLESRKWHFELADRCGKERCHPHFVCNGCGQTRCLTHASSPPVKIHSKGFIIHRQQIKLEGLCPSCSSTG